MGKIIRFLGWKTVGRRMLGGEKVRVYARPKDESLSSHLAGIDIPMVRSTDTATILRRLVAAKRTEA